MPDTDLATLSAEDMLAGYARCQVSPVEVLQAVTERIARLNPGLNAFAVMNPNALQAAGESESRWRSGRPIGPLDGVPVTVKDLVDLGGFPTRRGSRTTSADPVPDDAPMVMSLKAAGAVVIGKTTTTEFGWKSPGDCPLHGITRNPWNPAYTTGGSSSGAGAAGAAGFGPLHVGTDAGGSVRIPAAWCGLVGLKPTYGRIPQWPASAFASVSCAGPMTRTVRDTAVMFSAMARWDLRDPFCLPDDPRNWLEDIEDGVEGTVIGVLSNPGFDAPCDADGIAAVERAAQLLSEAGAIVEQVDPGLPDTSSVFGRVWGAALARLVAGMSTDKAAMLDPGIRQVAQTVGGMSAIEFMDAEATRAAAAHAMARLHQRYDLVLCPTVPGGPPLADAPIIDPVRSLWTDWAPWTFAFNLTRQPTITVPMGPRGDGLPNSVQIAAAQFRDDLVLRAARAIEVAQPFPVAAL
ncbi:amidase [Rhodopila sp.]|jgi:aspartyl-tRNA(Asn)/glutamyl-tRNA(Gln) amidotransferase subunit A|uniref:amidase n=1 Tax=Rhodopila sp. TaxID=2480087 RepID=UPI002CCE8225|nr:amidase [Rhodopila sp.]HVZ09977.1 amidase [Rhodopila sp.]